MAKENRFASYMITPLARLVFLNLLLIGICFLQGHLHAQVPKMRFKKYGVAEGLPADFVNTIIQDDQGYIWFATQGGLVKYDGYAFTTYRPASQATEENQLNFLNVVGGIFQGGDNKIWIGGIGGSKDAGGLASFDPLTGSFTHHLKESPLYASLGTIYYLGIELRGEIWFVNIGSSSGCLLCRYNPHTKELATYPCTNFSFRLSKHRLSGGSNKLGVATLDSSLWLLDFHNNLLCYAPQLDSFVQVLAVGAPLPGTPVADSLRGMSTERNGSLLFFGDKGVYQWDPVQKSVIRYFVQEEEGPAILPSGKIKYGFEDQRGMYWVVNTEKELCVIDPRSGKSSIYSLGKGELRFSHAPEDLVNSSLLISDERGVILALNKQRGEFAGYLFYDFKTESFSFYDPYFNQKENLFKPERLLPRYMLRDRSGLLWLGMKWNGLFRQTPKQQALNLYTHDPELAHSLPSNFVRKILEDQQGRIWVATDKGLARYIPDLDQFHIFTSDPQNPNTICDNNVRDLFLDSDGQIWVATNGGLNRWLEDKQLFERILYQQTNAQFFQTFMEDQQGRLWVTGRGDGVFILDRKRGKLIRHFTPGNSNSKGLTSAFFSVIYQDVQGNIWLGDNVPNDHGIFRLSASEDSFIAYPLPHSLGENKITFMVEDSLQRLWAGVDFAGLSRYDPKEDRFVRDPDLFDPSSVTLTSPMGYAKNEQGQIWVKTYLGGGLGQLHANNNKLILHGEEKGAQMGGLTLRPQAHQLPIDASGKIWLPLTTGLSVYDPSTQRFTNFYQKDGFQPYSSMFYTCLASSDGYIWIGGEFGLNRIPPQKIFEKDSTLPQVHITGLGILDSTYRKPDGNIFTQAISYTDEIELNHDQNDLRFEFIALHYLRSEDNQYAWKLENYDDDWTTPSLDRKASYTNLDPGTYTFRVKASNVDGIWNEEGASLTIIIHPPWWATWWARAIFLALLLALTYLIYRYQLSRQLEQAETRRLKDLDTVKSRLYTNITHEFRTPLTVIGGMAKKISTQPQEAEQMILRNSNNLLRLVNQMLDLSKLESGKLSINMAQGNVINYLRYLTESFQSYAASKQLNLVFYTESEKVIMDYDAEKLQHIISNLLSNAIKFSPEKSKIVLHTNLSKQEETEQLIIKVKDQGVGITSEALAHIFDRFYQGDDSSTRKGEGTGIGLTFTKELVHLLGGTIAVDSQLNQGSTFTVSLPVSRQAAIQADTLPSEPLEMIPASSEPTSSQASTGENQPLVLIVEDNPDVAFYIQSCLEPSYQVITAENGRIGIDKALAHSPDLIISDVMMPEKDGFEVCQTLKQDDKTSHIPIILLTAKADVESRIAGLQEGADAYLAKPFEKQELLVRMEQLIHLRKKLQERYRGGDLSPMPAVSTDQQYKREDSFIRKVQLLIEGQLSEPDLKIDMLARELGMSRSQLFRKVKALTGKSAMQFVRSYRLGRARQLLLSTDLSVAEVAYEVGYKTPSHFSASFLEEFGSQPSSIRDKKS